MTNKTSTTWIQPFDTGGQDPTPVEVTLDERGIGHPILLLHGGGGPQTVVPFADLLAREYPTSVLTPTHPGFGGTKRPDGLSSIAGLVALYAGLLETRDLTDVTVVGNSLGGWIAAELALLLPTRISSLVIVDGVGIEVPEHPVADFFSLTMDQVAELGYYKPDAFRIDPSALPAAAQAVMAENRAALAVYAGQTMSDPGLRARLASVTVPTLVIWGEADRIADTEYGRAYAAAIPSAGFQLLREAGHLPQIETPEALAASIWQFADQHPTSRPRRN